MEREMFRLEKNFLSYMRLIIHSETKYGSDSLIHINSIYFERLFLHRCIGSSKKMDGILNRYNLKNTGQIYKFGVLKCSENFKVLDLS